MMDYEDFYDLAKYCNENWKGNFSEREVALYAYCYTVDFGADGLKSQIIKSLLEGLKEDEDNGCEEAIEWIRRLTHD